MGDARQNPRRCRLGCYPHACSGGEEVDCPAIFARQTRCHLPVSRTIAIEFTTSRLSVVPDQFFFLFQNEAREVMLGGLPDSGKKYSPDRGTRRFDRPSALQSTAGRAPGTAQYGRCKFNPTTRRDAKRPFSTDSAVRAMSTVQVCQQV